MDAFRHWVDLAGLLMEGAGVGVMVFGAVVALVLALARRGRGLEGAYRRFRQDMGRAILLGLELLVAADIIRTVSEEPTLNGVLVLGLIVVIRTFLSFTLSVELEGRWPWQRAQEPAHPGHTPPPPPLHGSPPPGPAPADEERPAHH
jgi:uncharacterized membrane protein